jgi:hypothetical protein
MLARYPHLRAGDASLTGILTSHDHARLHLVTRFLLAPYVYRNVFCRYPTVATPGVFRPVRFQVKYTRARHGYISQAARRS